MPDLAFAVLLVYLVVELLPDRDVAGLSLHFELAVIVGVLTLWHWRAALASVPRAVRVPLVRLLVIYLAFVAWSALTRILRDESILDVAESVVSRHGVTLVGFAAIVASASTITRLRLLVATLSSVLIVHLVVAALQAAKVEVAWDLWVHMERWSAVDPPTLDEALTGLLPPGLTGNAFVLTYYIAVFMPLLAVWWNIDTRRGRGAAMVAVFIGVVAAVRERSLLVAIGMTAVAWSLYSRSLVRRIGVRLRGVTTMLMLVVVLAVGLIVAATAFSSSLSPEGTDLGARFLDIEDDYRVKALDDTFSAVADEPLLGVGDRAKTEGGRVLSPHNLFLNPLAFSGIPALILVIGTVVAMLLLLHRCVSSAIDHAAALPATEQTWLARISVAGTVGVFAYLGVAQFHNAGLQSGDFLPWWGVAVVIVAARLAEISAPLPQRDMSEAD